MKIFLSWSGKRSKYIASLMNDWIPKILHHVSFWYSTDDIEKGKQWFVEIQKALNDIKFGIICLTPENLHSDWLHFEAGALQKEISDVAICTLLYDVKSTEVKYPLAAFQATNLKSKSDFKKLIVTINNHMNNFKIDEDKLNYSFNKVWTDINKQLEKIPTIDDNQIEKKIETRSAEDMVGEILQEIRNQSSNPFIKNDSMRMKRRDIFKHHALSKILEQLESSKIIKNKSIIIKMNPFSENVQYTDFSFYLNNDEFSESGLEEFNRILSNLSQNISFSWDYTQYPNHDFLEKVDHITYFNQYDTLSAPSKEKIEFPLIPSGSLTI